MPLACRFPAMQCHFNSHMPCRAPAILRQCRVLHESPHGSQKYPNCLSYSFTDRYASDNKLRGTPRSSRRKPNAGRSRTGRLRAVDANSQYHAMPCPCRAHAAPMPCPCRAHAALCSGLEKSLLERHGRGMARARHGMCEPNTAALCKSKGKGTI
jgi:hypothetical protein